MDANHFPLTPIIHPWVHDFLEQKEAIYAAIAQHGSPINVHNMTPFDENLSAFKKTFDSYGLKSKIFFARKANKCKFLVEQAQQLNHGVDTASYMELKQALEVGVPAANLVCTAAVKNRKLIALAIEAQVPLVLDNEDECALIQTVAEEMNATVPIQVRLSGFIVAQQLLPSRFGFERKTAYALITESLGEDKQFDRLLYQGLHFHLNGYSIPQRAISLHQCLDLVAELKADGIPTKSVDFGGGILINYLKDRKEWEAFQEALKEAVLHKREALTFQNDGLGLLNIEGRLYFDMQVYPYYNEVNKTTFLEQILTFQGDGPKNIFQRALEQDIELRIEPGRSSLDQVGITIAKVAFRRYHTDGQLLIGLEMNRTQLRSASADFLLDPIHIIQGEVAKGESCEGYLVGAYCLEQELILKRKLYFHQLPQVDDLFVFINTAGYMMHFYESEAHLFPLAKNFVYHTAHKMLEARD